MSEASSHLRAVLYVRVSSDDVAKGHVSKEEKGKQASTSIRAQESRGLALIKSEGYKPVLVKGEDGKLSEPVLVDDGVSGYKASAERKGFAELMRLVKAGKVDVIAARAIDRIGRNDNENSLIRLACADRGVVIHLFTGQIIDPRKSEDKFTLQIYQGLAELQSAQKSDAARNVTKQRREEGTLRAAKKTFGWKFEKHKPQESMKLEPTEAKAIQDAYEAILDADSPASLRSIRDEWNAKYPTVGGAKEWTSSSVRTVLLRPSNAGFIRLHGRTLDYMQDARGKWETITDEETYLKVKRILESPSRRTTRGRKAEHLVSGIAKCGVCGSSLQSSSVAGKEPGQRRYTYRCESKSRTIQDAEKKKRHVSAGATELDSITRRKVIAAVDMVGDKFNEEANANASELYDEREAIKMRRSELLAGVGDLYELEDISSNLRALKASEAELAQRIEEAEATRHYGLSDLRPAVIRDHKVQWDSAIEYRQAIGAKFDALPVDERRALVRYFYDLTVRPASKGQTGPERFEFVPKPERLAHLLQDDDDTWNGSDSHEEETGVVVRFTEGGNYSSM